MRSFYGFAYTCYERRKKAQKVARTVKCDLSNLFGISKTVVSADPMVAYIQLQRTD